MDLFMGIDTGTQGVRICIAAPDGRVCVSSERKWDTEYPRHGWAEQDPAHWWHCIGEVMQECLGKLAPKERESIVSCCIGATSSTVFAVAEDGTPLMKAIMWMDARARNEAEQINACGHEILKDCGGSVSFEWLVPKILWIKRHEPEIYTACDKIVEQLDWLNYQFCGKWVGSMCNAVCKWNFVKSKGGFVGDFFTQIGLPDYKEKMLTDLLPIGETIGRIRPEIADKYGLNPDMRIVQGGIDAHMAMFGMNVIGNKQMGIIMGTSFVHLSLVDKVEEEIRGIWGPYDSAVIDGKWLLEGGQITASGLVNWFRKNFHIESGNENPYQKLMDAAAEIEPGADGVTMLDFFQGNRTPYKDADAQGVIYGLNIKHTWKHIYRALIESVAFGTRNIVDNQIDQGYNVDTITACGGVTKDVGWMQIIADVTGKELLVNEESQAVAMGGCVVAAAGGRHFDSLQKAADAMVKIQMSYHPDMQKHQLYEKPYQTYRQLYENLKEMMKG